jgi:cystathionine gamma-lyase
MKESKSGLKFETLAIHAGQYPDPTTGAIMTPIFQTSTFVQEGPGIHKGYEYARSQNPTRTALEKNLAALEKAKYGACFSSGCAAMMSTLHTLKSGDHIVCCDDVYGGTYRLFTKAFAQFGLAVDFVDLTKTGELEKHIRPNTKLVWIETPTNPLLKLIDIAAIAKFCKSKEILCLVDNTFMSPYFQNPLELGASIVLHSTTKYIGGHSDVVGGFVGTNHDEFFERLKFFQNTLGAVPGPMDCFLTLRGTKTLHVRMQRHAENAAELAAWLEKHPQVERVIYPGLSSHPQHELAKRQARGYGGMISFVAKGGLTAAKKILSTVNIFACAESLGGVESLIEHPAIMTHASVPAEMRAKLGIHDGLIRISVGIENLEDLRADLDHAMKGL